MDNTGSSTLTASALSRFALTRRGFLATVGAGLLASCSDGGSPSASPPLQGKLFYGASVPNSNLDAFEGELEGRLSCHRSYFQPDEQSEAARQGLHDLAASRLPLLSIKPPASWAATARDTRWLDSVVEPLGALPGPVYLIVHHEPEDDASRYGTPADFVAMQDAVLRRAADAGSNITVAPVLSAWSFDEQASRNPGEWNVDNASVYGLDLYNPWSPTNGKAWVSFADRLAVAEEEAAGRPLLVAEYGCRTDASQPGRAADWMQDAFASALGGGVVAMAYFNSYRNSRDGTWELDDETLPVFQTLLHSAHVARV